MALPARTPDFVSILLTAVAYNLRVRDPQDRNFEMDFRRAFAEAAHTIGVYHRAEPMKYNYFYGQVRNRISDRLRTPSTQKALGPIATGRQVRLPFTGPLKTPIVLEEPPRYLMKIG